MPNKEAEEFYIKRLVELGIDLPGEQIESSESPDFLVPGPESVLGIEVQEIFQPHESSDGASKQAQEALRERTLSDAKEVHDRNGGRPVHVAVTFSEVLLDTRRVSSLAQEIADLIGEARVPPGKCRVWEVGEPDSAFLPREIRRIRVHHVQGASSSRWPPANAGFIPELGPAEIQKLIDKKDYLVDTYRAKCSTIWLVLAIAGYPLSQCVELSEDVESYPFVSHFDRVLILDHFKDRVLNLTLVRDEG